MKTRKISLAFPLILIFGMVSCGDGLSEDELQVIDNDIAHIVYNSNIDRRVERVIDYLTESVGIYSDEAHDTTQAKIDERNATSALMGGSMFDIGELYGSSTNQIIAKKYYNYIDYVNERREFVDDDAKAIVKIIKANPNVVDSFLDGQTNISLLPFRSVEGIPSSISYTQFNKYKNLDQNRSNRSQWGQLLMGTVQHPEYSPVTLLCALVTQIERLKYPTPVYAVYKKYDDEEGWEVGYDTSQAYFITFEEDGDILEYDYEPVDYFEGYINSENNKLNK